MNCPYVKIILFGYYLHKIQQHTSCKALSHPRDENLRRLRQVDRKQWKQESGYHRRSLSETAMFRLKVIFRGQLRRFFENLAALVISSMCCPHKCIRSQTR
ncbi:hypothetical protein [Nostoc sp.]|uniref:hypothetical protein n=1 Tax=Nostoc sp. TaxID=1180 RepID=UPI003FA57CCF